jgi:hypothetical protein
MTDQQIQSLRAKLRKALRLLSKLQSEQNGFTEFSEDEIKESNKDFYKIYDNYPMDKFLEAKEHQLKTETEYYQAVEKGLKQFELRKNDRNFKVGDILILVEVVNEYATGRKLGLPPIKYIMHGGKYGLDEGYCILGW